MNELFNGLLTQDTSRDEHWSSRVIDIDRINVPTFVIGSWSDIFPEAMVDVYSRLSAPKKLLMGPWMHGSPDTSATEPVDYLSELLRWWDHWLKGKDTGVMDEPPVTLYVQGDGWKHAQDWPSSMTEDTTYFLGGGNSLADQALSQQGSDVYTAVPTVGTTSTLWDPLSIGVGLPLDQGPDDRLSLTYSTEPLTKDIEIRGSPEAVVHATIEKGEDVNLVAKLCDVGPDGSSSLITTGWLKGSHYRSHEEPQPLKPNQAYEFRIKLWATSYLVRKGHRLRLSLSCSDFPRIWPTPSNPTIRVLYGSSQPSCLRIPMVVGTADLAEPRIKRPDTEVNRAPGSLASVPTWKVERDIATNTVTVRCGQRTEMVLHNGGRFALDHTATARVQASRPDGADLQSETVISFESPVSGLIQIETDSWTSHEGMALNARITMDGHPVFEKRWHR